LIFKILFYHTDHPPLRLKVNLVQNHFFLLCLKNRRFTPSIAIAAAGKNTQFNIPNFKHSGIFPSNQQRTLQLKPT